MDREPDTTASLDARQKYAKAFTGTLIDIWHEKQRRLFGRRTVSVKGADGRRLRDSSGKHITRKLRRTGNLIRSTIPSRQEIDDRALEMTFAQKFREYGIYVDAGTGRETPRGNRGDIGRYKRRKAQPWFSRKYYLSVMNLRDFMAENLGLDTINLIARQLRDKALREGVTTD